MNKSAVFRGFINIYGRNPGESTNKQREESLNDSSISEKTYLFHRRIKVS